MSANPHLIRRSALSLDHSCHNDRDSTPSQRDNWNNRELANAYAEHLAHQLSHRCEAE